MKHLLNLLAFWILALALLSGCGGGNGSDSADADAPDITQEKEEYYATFKRPPPELKAKLDAGEIDPETYQLELAKVPNFFQFKTPDDVPANLEWKDGMELPDIGSPEAIKGGTYYSALQDYPRTLRIVGPDSNGSFRPYLLDDVMLQFAHRHPNVTEIGPDGHYYFPGIAKEWAIDKDSRTVYVRINPLARWSDGEPITSDDMLFTFFMFHQPYIRAPWYNDYYVEWYEGITKYDDLTFSVTVAKKKPDLNARVLELRPLPEHFYQELGDDYVDRYQWRFVPTSGAYVVKEEDIRKGRSIALTRLEDWWAKDNKFLRNRFNYNKLHFTVIRDVPKMFETFLKGEIYGTGLVNLPEYWYEKLPNDDPKVAHGYIKKMTFFNEVPRPTYGLWMNQDHELLSHRDIRVGVNYATNFERVIQEYFRGDYVRMRTTADGYGDFTHPTIQARPFNVTKALEHFAQAGFKERGDDGILVDGNGRRLAITLSTGYPHFQDMLTILKEEALKAGLDFNLQVLDGTTGWKMVQEKKHEIHFSAFNVSPEMYPRYWETYHSSNAYDVPFLPDGVTPNPQRKLKVQTNNLQSIADPKLDALINQYRRSDDAEEMRRLAFTMEEILYEDASFCPGFVRPFFRSAVWRWVRYPDDYNVKLARSGGEYFLGWIDPEEMERTKTAMRNGESFGSGVEVYDQYRETELTAGKELGLVREPARGN